MNIATYAKEPNDTTDYEIDWSDFAGSRTITTSTWTVPSGITEVTDANSATTTSIRLTGGTWGESYLIDNQVTFNTGEIETRSITINIQFEVAYCTTSEVRRRAAPKSSGAGTSASTNSLTDAELLSLIEQSSRMFDQLCRVPPGYFNQPLYPDPTSRTFYGDDGFYLKLDPYIPGSLNTTLTVPDGYTAPSFVEREGYLLISSNGVLLNRSCPWSVGWWQGVPITVSAKWGFPSTPEDVRLAVIELIINLWRETDPANVKLVNLEGQPLRETVPPRVNEIAKKYRGRFGVLV